MSKEPKEEMTREQFEEYKKITMESIEAQLPLLLKELEYQRCVTEMEELRARYIRAVQMIANISAPPPEPKDPEGTQAGKPTRELKKEPA